MPSRLEIGPEEITQARVQALIHDMQNPADGAVGVFLGQVRNHAEGHPVEALEYEAYGSMALLQMQRIAADLEQQYAPLHLTVLHRIGRLEIGEIALAVVAAAPHRGEVFAAMQLFVDRLKAEVPIWKKEHFADGTPSQWVACSCVHSSALHVGK